ncbi:hypothetical protein ABKN59_007472 [Abortiporus biennis]
MEYKPCEICGQETTDDNHFVVYADSQDVCNKLRDKASSILQRLNTTLRLKKMDKVTVNEEDVASYLLPVIVAWTRNNKTRFMKHFNPSDVNLKDSCREIVKCIVQVLRHSTEVNKTGRVEAKIRDRLRRILLRLCIADQSRNIWPENFVLTKIQIHDRSHLPHAATYVEYGSHSKVCVYSAPGEPAYAIKFLLNDSPRPLNSKHVPLVSELLIWWNLDHRRLLKLEGITNEAHNLWQVQPGLVTRFMKHGTIRSYRNDCYSRNDLQNPDKLRKHLQPKVNAWITHVAEGLDYLHAEGVAHGDLRIENIVINDNYEALICDFGLSVFVHNTSGAGGSERAGNHLYHPPEFYFDFVTSQRQKPETDIWDFGLFCIELFINHSAVGRRDHTLGGWIKPSPLDLMTDLSDQTYQYWPKKPDFHGGRPMTHTLWALVDDCLSLQMVKRPKAATVLTRLKEIGSKLVEI